MNISQFLVVSKMTNVTGTPITETFAGAINAIIQNALPADQKQLPHQSGLCTTVRGFPWFWRMWYSVESLPGFKDRATEVANLFARIIDRYGNATYRPQREKGVDASVFARDGGGPNYQYLLALHAAFVTRGWKLIDYSEVYDPITSQDKIRRVAYGVGESRVECLLFAPPKTPVA